MLSEGQVEQILNAGADLDAKDEYGNTPLHKAANYGWVEAVRVLLELGRTALMLAAFFDRDQVILLLVGADADVEAKDDGGKTALRMAAGKNHLCAVRVLVKSGANIDARDEHDETPLSVAKKEGYNDVSAALTEP